jgi:hypothetical protein
VFPQRLSNARRNIAIDAGDSFELTTNPWKTTLDIYSGRLSSSVPEFLSDRSDGSAIQHLQGMREHNSLLYMDMLRVELLQLSRLGQ